MKLPPIELCPHKQDYIVNGTHFDQCAQQHSCQLAAGACPLKDYFAAMAGGAEAYHSHSKINPFISTT